ncbi:494_t:CDS:10 [Acaulospora morrowiae]|uniref:494_t:CDS:1 n=1 Tax=Acaulospora morrowiae TaxID=94023 RepID=A0A9N9CYB1_9GLOM|nr:494_t:CDS:10 [Acaulospora morrowiae]
MAGIWKKKKSKQSSPEITESNSYNKITSHYPGQQQPQQTTHHSNHLPHYHTQTPGEQPYYQETPSSNQHSRSTSRDHNSASSSYYFPDSSNTSTSRGIESGASRISGAFSPSELQAWVGNYYRETFGGKNELPQLTDEQIEEMFLELMNKRDLKNLSESQRKAMLAIPTEKKLLLIKNDLLQEKKTKPNSTDILISSHDKNAPEWYLKRIMDGTITVQHMNSLSVSLRTLPITWVRSFIDAKGLEVLANHLNSITRKAIKREVDLQMEYEIVKCLKSLLNNRWGAQEALSHPTCIYSITFSLVSPQLNTRKLVAEVLSFFCYCEIPTGHNLVLGGFDQLMQFRSEHGRFDAWMRILESTIDGRGRHGSLVNAAEEYKKSGMGIDGSLMEYALANMILVNSIIGVCDDVEIRVHLRNQLHACGLTRIIDKMKAFNYELITRQISKFERESELDYEDVLDFYNQQIMQDMTYPLILGTRAYDFFLSAMQHMLLIRSNDVEVRTRYFQLIDSLITQVVMDKHGIDQEWNNSVGLTVSQVLSKMADQDKIQAALEEAKEAKALAEKALHEKHELQKELASRSDETVGELRNKIDSLEELLRISRHTIQTLQQKLIDLEASYYEKLTEHNVELRDFERILKEQQNAPDSGSMNRQEIMMKLERMQEIAKTEAKLVGGKVWTPTFGDFKMPDASDYIYNQNGHNAATTGTTESQSTSAVGHPQGQDSQSMPNYPLGFTIPDQPQMNSDLMNDIKNYKRKNGGKVGSQDDSSSDLIDDSESNVTQDEQNRLQSGVSLGDDKVQSQLSSSQDVVPSSSLEQVTQGPPLSSQQGVPIPPSSPSGPPPPPPPPGKGGPAPPRFGATAQPRKELPFMAKKKLLQLQWDKLNTLTINKTFWGQANMSEEELLRLLGGEFGVFASIEELFAAKELALKKKKAEKKDEISVLDPKRAYNINVVLGRYKQVTFEEIHKKIVEMDEFFCTENFLSQLMQYTPTPDERGKLAVFKEGTEDFDNLARADRFFVEVMKIHRYEQRLKFMYFYVTFSEKFTDLNDSIVSILNASIALKDSKHFKELMNLILLLGNYMNGSGLKGGAFGFKIASINKLVDTKASNNSSITLLHFLADTVEEKTPHILGFAEELKDCGSACRVSQQDMMNEYRMMGTKLNDLAVELQMHYTDVELEENDKFPEIMKEFVVKSQEKFEQLRVKYTSMEVAYKDVLSYFGEDVKNTKPDEFFGIFKTFITSFERVRSDNKKVKERELSAQRRREEIENRKKRAAATSPGVHVGEGVTMDSSEEKHLMDNLLETLRDGRDLDTRSRNRRGNRRVARSMSIALKAESILNRLKEDAPPLPEMPKQIVAE